MCERLHVLPKSGGMFDQDPRVMKRFRLVLRELDEAAKETLNKKSEEQKTPPKKPRKR